MANYNFSILKKKGAVCLFTALWHLPSPRGDGAPVRCVCEGDGCLGVPLTSEPGSSVLTSVPDGLRDQEVLWEGTAPVALVFSVSLVGRLEQRRLLGGGW